MRFQQLHAAPRALVDGLSTKLLTLLAPVANQARLVAFLRLFFVECGRIVGVAGCSIRAIAMRAPDELIEATARVMAVLLPDQPRIVGVYETALAAMRADPAWTDGNREVADPELSPLRGQPSASQSPDPNPAASMSRGSESSMADDVALSALRVMGEQARRERPWRTTHGLLPEDGFTTAEVAALASIPPYGWAKEDDNAARLLRAVRGIAKHLLRYATTPVPEVLERLRIELTSTRRTLGPTWLGGLHFLLLSPASEQYARIVLAELAQSADADAPDDLVPRLVLARTMSRADKTEAAQVLAAKTKNISCIGDLPLQLREKISRWA